MYPAGIASLSLVFSQKALQWLYGTTTDDDGRETVNFILFGDLLARMALTAGEGKEFRRPLTLSAGQAQYSEKQLSVQWNMGRKRIRNLLAILTDLGLIDTNRSRVASVMTFPCIRGWKTADGSHTDNTFSMNRGKNKSRADNDRAKTAFPVVPQSGNKRHPFRAESGRRTGGVAWSDSVELRDMPRYYRLRTVLPRRSRNVPKGRCPSRSQARTFPF